MTDRYCVPVSAHCRFNVVGSCVFQKTSSKSIPFYIRHPENKLLPMAGLWDIWKNASDESTYSYTVITTKPAPEIEYIHHRMPVILNPKHINPWLQIHNTSIPNAMALLKPYMDPLKAYPVSTLVNSPRNNRKECILPIEESNSLSLF